VLIRSGPGAIRGLTFLWCRARLTPLIRKTQPYAKKIGHIAGWAQMKVRFSTLIEIRQELVEQYCSIEINDRDRDPLTC
jgi:hypothetical protein